MASYVEALQRQLMNVGSVGDTLSRFNQEEEAKRARLAQEQLANAANARAEESAAQQRTIFGQEQEERGIKKALEEEANKAYEAYMNDPYRTGKLEGPEDPAVKQRMYDSKAKLMSKLSGNVITGADLMNEEQEKAMARETAKLKQEAAGLDVQTGKEALKQSQELFSTKKKQAEANLTGTYLSNEEKRQRTEQLKKQIENIAKGGVDPEKANKIAGDLRKEYIAQNKAFQSQSEAFGRIQASAQDPSAAGDLAMIFNYMKILDPGSVVRESEFATAAQARGWLSKAEDSGVTVPGFIVQAIQKMDSGQRLLPEQRKDFLDRSMKLYDKAREGYGVSQKTYGELAQKAGIDPSMVTINLERVAEPTKEEQAQQQAKSFNDTFGQDLSQARPQQQALQSPAPAQPQLQFENPQEQMAMMQKAREIVAGLDPTADEEDKAWAQKFLRGK